MTHKLATAYNTIGILYGREEPGKLIFDTIILLIIQNHLFWDWIIKDRYVLVGNHMDSWTLGGIDPASGTSVLIEMARTFGNIKMQSGNNI
jgi:hypothetical protein